MTINAKQSQTVLFFLGGPDLSDLYITSRGDSAEPTGKLYVARLHGTCNHKKYKHFS